MSIEEFWNQAFLAALVRLPAARAKKEADAATEMCISRWQEEQYNWSPSYLTRWKDQDIDKVPITKKSKPGPNN